MMICNQMSFVFGVNNVDRSTTTCEDTYDHDCSEYISYCNNPEYAWMPEVCKKTCGYCHEGKVMTILDAFILLN